MLAVLQSFRVLFAQNRSWEHVQVSKKHKASPQSAIAATSRIGVAGNGKSYPALTVSLTGLAMRVFDAILFLKPLIAVPNQSA